MARRHSVRMADAGRLFHNQDLQAQVSGWRALGENVGRGATPDQVHQNWMSSDGHRANLLGPGFDDVGIGVEQRGGTLWITQVFRERPSSPEPDPQPAPEPAPEPAPAPAPRPSLVGDRLARALAVTDVADGGPPPGELLLSTRHDARG